MTDVVVAALNQPVTVPGAASTVAAGGTGPQGPQGATGATGPQGASGTAKAINVEDHGANASSLTNYAAITEAITASALGDTIFFPHIYNVEQPIAFKPWRTYRGSNRGQSGLKMAPGANADAVAASEGWLGTSITAAEGPITIEHMSFDGNRNNQTGGLGHGFVGMNFWATVYDIDAINCRGDGLRWSAARRDGIEISGSMVECHFEQVFLRNNTGYGFRVFDPTPTVQTITDGFAIRVIVQSPGQDGIRIDCAQGWKIDGCHVYTAPQHGIHVNRAGSCSITDCYIETWGTSSTAGTYAGICAGDNSATFIGDPFPLIIEGNKLFFAGTAAVGSNIRGILCSTGNGNTSHITIDDNGVYNTGAQNVGVGVRVVNQGATANTVLSYGAGNRVDGWPANSAFTVSANGGGMTINGAAYPQVLATTATAGFARFPTMAGRPTNAPADTSIGAAGVVNTSGPELCLYFGGAWHFIPIP